MDRPPDRAFIVGAPQDWEPPPVPPRAIPTDYTRVPVSSTTFRDATGQVIPYGHRWPFDVGPAESSYSVCAHPQRFEPVLEVARGLIDYLESHYRVSVLRGEDVRLNPARGAPLRFQLREEENYAGVTVHAGALTSRGFPHCGCDACDEDVPELLDELELFVFAVVQGDFAEWRRGRWVGHTVYSGDAVVSEISYKAERKGPRVPGRYPAWSLTAG